MRIRASGVNPIDWKVRAGNFSHTMQHKLPLVIGWDVSGVIEASGDGASSWKQGEEVYAHPPIARDGSYAQYIRLPEAAGARKPKTLDHVHAAGLPLAALAAWQSLFDAGGLARGQRVLIHGAAGGVGHLAVQLAKWKGALVIGTASRQDAALVTDLGADEVIDYQATRFETVVRDADVVLDTIGGEVQQRSWAVLRPGGILVSTLAAPSREAAARYRVRVASPFVQPNGSQLRQIADLVDRGRLRLIVGTVLPLVEARRAHELGQTGQARGKTVLSIA